MKQLKRLLALCTGFTALFGFQSGYSQNECCGKLEIAPVFAHLDVLIKEKTNKKINLGGVRIEGNYLIYKGLLIKPMVLYGKGDGGELTSASLGLGVCIPATKCLTVTPSIGGSYTCLNTKFHHSVPGIGDFAFKENMLAGGPYICLEGSYKIRYNLRISASVQYAWSWSRTKIRTLRPARSNSGGPVFSTMVEYDLNPKWSINLGYAYNESLSREKDGLRGYGVKLGIARWF